MPLFGKKNKQQDAPKKAKKQKQDAFMRRALYAKFPGSKAGDLMNFEFTETFSEDRLKALGKVTDRAVLGRGEFDKVYQQAKAITRDYAPFISGDKALDDQKAGEIVGGFEELERLAEAWLASSEAKWSAKSGRKDPITQAKEVQTRELLKGARMAIFQLKNRAAIESDETQDLLGELEGARDGLANGGNAGLERYRTKDAEVLGKVCGTRIPGNGTSDVKLVNGPDGDVAYAFKSVKGESDMMGTPKGFGTAREVLMSKLTEKLGFGWPKVTMARMDGEPGALIDGVQGVKFNTNELAVEDVPAEALQKVLLTNLVGGQFDIKWEDVRFNMKDGKLEPTCMDGGAAMPDPDTRANFLLGAGDGKPGQTIVTHPGHGGILDEAKKPMDPALVQKLLAIDTNALRAEMNRHAGELQTAHGLDVQALGLDTGIETSIESIEGIQAILRGAPKGQISLADLLARYHAEVISTKMMEPARAAWEAKQIDDYNAMVDIHGELLAPLPGPLTSAQVQDLYLSFTHPENQAYLRKLADLADPRGADELMKAYGQSLPISAMTSAIFAGIKKIHDAIGSDLPEYEKHRAKYPTMVEAKANFGGDLAKAYTAVLTAAQKGALSRLVNMAAEVGQAEQITLKPEDLLARYGYATPTSDFKRIADDIGARLRQAKAQQQAQQG